MLRLVPDRPPDLAAETERHADRLADQLGTQAEAINAYCYTIPLAGTLSGPHASIAVHPGGAELIVANLTDELASSIASKIRAILRS